jgi:hypothetical protein
MIRIDVPQGSPEWVTARLGIPTASNFHRIITSKTQMPSASANGYMNELLAELMLGVPMNDAETQWMQRGRELEPEAVSFYEFQTGCKTESVGLCLRDDRLVGCSPDRLIGADGGLEIKCPAAKTHIGYLLGSPTDDYVAQVQGAMYITGAKWWDLLSYNPEMPPALVRVERDSAFIDALDDYLGKFLAKLSIAKVRLSEMGCVPAQRRAA